MKIFSKKKTFLHTNILFLVVLFFLFLKIKWQCFSLLLKNQKYFPRRLSSTPDTDSNDSAKVTHDFDKPVYQAEEEGDEDCDLPEELARLLR